MKTYKIRYKEVGRSRIGETTYSDPLSETEASHSSDWTVTMWNGMR